MRFHATPDFREFDQCVARTKNELAHQLRQGVTGAGAEVVAHVRSNAPFKDRTGALRRGVHVERTTATPRSVDAWVVSPQYYAAYVEFGTRPHEIWPKAPHGTRKAKRRPNQSAREASDIGTHRVALRWYVGGRPVFARMVNHPGSKPYPFMQPARDYAQQWLVMELDEGFYRLQAIWNR
jgi:hypothetical protein